MHMNFNLIHQHISSAYDVDWFTYVYVRVCQHKCCNAKAFCNTLVNVPLVIRLTRVQYWFQWIDLICCFNTAAVHLFNIDTWNQSRSTSPTQNRIQRKKTSIIRDRLLTLLVLFIVFPLLCRNWLTFFSRFLCQFLFRFVCNMYECMYSTRYYYY